MKKLSYIIILLFIGFSSYSQDFPDKPSTPRLVNDFAAFLSPTEAQQLEQRLTEFSNQTSTQIAIVIVKTINGYDPSQYATELAEKWGIGQKGKDNGLLILVKPKTDNEKGEVYIATGYGLEDVIPDITCNHIVQKEIIPRFKEQRYAEGLNAAVTTIMDLSRGKFTADQYNKKAGNSQGTIIGLFFIMMIGFMVFSAIARKKAHTLGSGGTGSNLGFWALLAMMSAGNSRGSGSGWSDFSSGGGSFGGFGGGSFGGGGSGGSW